ncbi:FAD-dependent oxidoreductase [uncultured Rikenella sp.]|uniref:NAD(P)/FAD-dependent oxidoreductase n=1 Tax=uncultured Rikenella sp. TaxID=368003 RepID=UPI0026245CE8|nr:FAD-dependent oxidoreductase [uncultured Rikenella sp.]
MPQTVEITLTPKEAADSTSYTAAAIKAAGIRSPEDVAFCRVVRRSIDARRHTSGIMGVRVNMAVELWLDADGKPEPVHFEWGDVSNVPASREVIVVGAGPAGLFAALELIERGFKPIILERGKDVSTRKADIAAIQRNERVNPDSNYAFGEGGAGTYSDGKLYTRSKKRGNYRKALEILHFHGAPEEILYDAHPHIGTDRLPRVVAAMRETILTAGGRILFDTRVTDLLLSPDKRAVQGVETGNGERIMARAVVLATGHSARDIYELLHRKGILIEAKPFAMGVRVEHRQELIDRIQYKTVDPYLPAATYSLVAQVPSGLKSGMGPRMRGVYSFCMCPGGFIVPALTEAGECVVNGMSPSGRNNVFANAGIVTQILPEDFADLVPHFGPLAGMRFQQQLEKMGYAQGGGAQVAPAQRLDSFAGGFKCGETLPTSYHPGVVASDMDKWMPRFMAQALRAGFREFDKRMRGFLTAEAQVIGIESRTSSPVRIPRQRETGMHPQVAGLFPAGEGAGYAGGIISAAVDGAAVANAVVDFIRSAH